MPSIFLIEFKDFKNPNKIFYVIDYSLKNSINPKYKYLYHVKVLNKYQDEFYEDIIIQYNFIINKLNCYHKSFKLNLKDKIVTGFNSKNVIDDFNKYHDKFIKGSRKINKYDIESFKSVNKIKSKKIKT